MPTVNTTAWSRNTPGICRDPATRRNVSGLPCLAIRTVGPDEAGAIRRHVQCQHAFESNRFRAAVEALLGQSAGLPQDRQAEKVGSDATQPGKATPTLGFLLGYGARRK